MVKLSEGRKEGCQFFLDAIETLSSFIIELENKELHLRSGFINNVTST